MGRKADNTAGAIALKLMETNHFATIRGSRSEEVLIYNDKGIYEYNGETVIKEQVQQLLGEDANTHFVAEVIGHVRRLTYIDEAMIDEGENILNVSNGLVNIQECSLTPHTPLYHSFIQLPVRFDKNARCPKVEAFINSIFAREDAELVKEYLGFLLVKGYIFHRALMITGESHSGKTTFVNLVSALIGQQNIASVTLQDLCDKPFSMAELHKKLANISDDLPANPVRYAGQFKRLTGESKITAERKFKDPFIFTNTAKTIFTCNEVPPVQSSDDAYFYRWLIVETKRQFNKADCNRRMLQEITTEEELSGFLNLALRYRAKLLKQNDFTGALDIEKSRERYMLSVKDSVAKFINEAIRQDGDGWLPKDAIYETYMEWCSEYQEPVKAINAFHRRFQKLMGRHISDYYPISQGRQVKAYKGVLFKDGCAPS